MSDSEKPKKDPKWVIDTLRRLLFLRKQREEGQMSDPPPGDREVLDLDFDDNERYTAGLIERIRRNGKLILLIACFIFLIPDGLS